MQTLNRASWYQFSPFIAFIGLFLFLHIFFSNTPPEAKIGFAHFSCLLAIMYSMLTFPRTMSYNDRMAIFVQGAAQPTIVHMAYIFVICSVFTYFVAKNGGISAAVNLGLLIIPRYAILPGLFITVSLFALIIGTSTGAIAAFTPIALGFARKLNIDPSLAAAIVVSASLLGDNLSLISDTTIAATHITQCKMTDKFKENGILVLYASLITITILTILNITGNYAPTTVLSTVYTFKDVLNIVPYLVVLILALFGLDVLYVLTISTIVAVILGLWQGSYTFLQATTYAFEGFYTQPEMVNVLILVILITGLAHVIEFNGGFHFIIAKWDRKIDSARKAELLIALLISVITSAIAINVIAILIVGPLAKRYGHRFNIPRARVASILDIFACICQGLIPYSPQLLLASTLSHISTASLFPHLHYQYLMLVITLISIFWQTRKQKSPASSVAASPVEQASSLERRPVANSEYVKPSLVQTPSSPTTLLDNVSFTPAQSLETITTHPTNSEPNNALAPQEFSEEKNGSLPPPTASSSYKNAHHPQNLV